MPLVPFQTDVNAPLRGNAAYKPALDNLSRPRVSADNVQRGMQQLGQAVKVDTVDPSSFERAAGAMGPIGEAVARAGSVVGAAAAQHIKANSDLAILGAKGDQDLAEEQLRKVFSTRQNETAAFVPEAQRLTDEVAKKWLNDPRLTKADKARLAVELATWSEKQKIGADTFAKVTVNSQLKQGFTQRFQDLRSMDRPDEAKALLPQAQASGVFFPHELEHENNLNIMAGAEQQVKQLNAEATRLQSMGDHTGALALVQSTEAPEGMAADQWEKRKKSAVLQIEQRRDEADASIMMDSDPKLLQESLAIPSRFAALPPQRRAELVRQANVAREQAANYQTEQAEREVSLMPLDALKDWTPDKLPKDKTEQLTDWHRARLLAARDMRLGKSQVDSEAMYQEGAAWLSQYDPAQDPDGLAAMRAETSYRQLFTESGPYFKRLKEGLDAKLKSDPDKAPPELQGIMASVVNAARQSAIESVKDAQGRPLYRDAREVQIQDGFTTSGYNNIVRFTLFPFGGLFLPSEQKNPAYIKELENNGQLVPLTKANETLESLRVKAANAVNEQLLKEWQNPKTREAWQSNPEAIHARKRLLMSQHGLPVVPLPGPSASIVDPDGVGLKRAKEDMNNTDK